MKKEKNKTTESEYFKEAKNRAQEMKCSLLKGATLYDKDKIIERLYRMILYTLGRQDWYDNRMHRLLNIGIAFIATSVALATFMSAVNPHIQLITRIFGWLTTGCIFSIGISLTSYYNSKLARDHPYRKIVDIRSWYFIYNFPSGLKDNISKNFEETKKQVEETIDAYRVFLNRWLEYSSEQDKVIEEDLEQVFILQLLQKYRYQAVKNMSRILYYGIYVTVVLAGVAILGHVSGC